MRESGYYPMGAEYSKDAPWNASDDVEPVEKDCTFLCSMQKSSSVETTDYNPGYVGKEWDGDGWVSIHEDDDFSSTDWMNAWDECHETPLTLIKTLGNIAKTALDGEVPKMSKKQWQYILSECNGWEQMDEEIDY